jgi:hypothetical protein
MKPSLIIALGLLVDDPVVAGDAIKRDPGSGVLFDFGLGPQDHQVGSGASLIA